MRQPRKAVQEMGTSVLLAAVVVVTLLVSVATSRRSTAVAHVVLAGTRLRSDALVTLVGRSGEPAQ
ncbi:MAG: hypothetical protein ABW215_01925 [Kibdelosporangium sp.]